MTAPTLTITLPSRARYTLDVGRRVLTSGFAMHGHDHTELFIVLKGSGVHVLDGSRNFIRAGDVYVIRSGRSHAFTDCRNLEHYNIGFYPDLLSALGDELRRMEGFQRLFVLRPGRSRSADGLAKV